MLDFKIVFDQKNRKKYIETSLSGKALLTISQLNKGTSFSEEEREMFGLQGKLPIRIETLEEQAARAYLQFQRFNTAIQKNIFLNALQNTNQTLFYALIKNHIVEMMPYIYTPWVAERVKEHSREFRQARGLYITYQDKENISTILENRTNPAIKLIVVTDGERVLGLGDQGVGAMEIPISKLMIYSLCGAIHPNYTLPILLDVGTNNQNLLNDPLYLGLKHPRITGEKYNEFIHAFVKAIKNKFPSVFLHWEDFGRTNAPYNLHRYRDFICSFNDDIQGTGVAALAALLSAVKILKQSLFSQRIIIFGAGSAGTGITHQIMSGLLKAGLSFEEAKRIFWLVDKSGLILDNMEELTEEQKIYARKTDEIKDWEMQEKKIIPLLEVVKHVKPTVLIGCAAVPNAFNQKIVQTMAKYVEHPIILTLSNPNEKAEATPTDLIHWTRNKALIATGSPFEDVEYEGKTIQISQCNNAFVFPGIGLGAMAIQAKKISDEMLLAAAECLSELSHAKNAETPSLLPPISDASFITKQVALAVAKTAIHQNLANKIDAPLEELIDEFSWEPHYLPYRLPKG